MAVIVANVYQQAAMCTTEKDRAPRWLIRFALIYMSPLLHMQDKVKAVLSQTVSHALSGKVHRCDWIEILRRSLVRSFIRDGDDEFTALTLHFRLVSHIVH